VRTEPLPPEFPGANHYGEKEEEYILRVVKARNPLRFLDYGIDSSRIFCGGTMKNGAIPAPRMIYNDHLTVDRGSRRFSGSGLLNLYGVIL
jgi:hypothetical protein